MLSPMQSIITLSSLICGSALEGSLRNGEEVSHTHNLAKNTTFNSQVSDSDAHEKIHFDGVHLLWDKPERITPLEYRKSKNEIRYASFGSSQTWGAGLADRDKESYVWRLSENDQIRGVNYAIRGSGPNYPASCLNSMIGDEEYDVIILEFFTRAHEGLPILLTRLRERFPQAIIVVLKLWSPHYITSPSLEVRDVYVWAQQQGFGHDFIHDPKFKEALLATGEENWKYSFAQHRHNPLAQHVEEVAKSVDAYMVRLPFPINEQASGPTGWIALGDRYFGDDSFHLSKYGHYNIAVQIENIVRKVGVPKDRVVKPFSTIDLCYNWFESGNTGDLIRFSPNTVVEKMKNTEKYTASGTKYDKNGHFWMQFSNPTDEELEFVIGYMTTGPKPSKYPKVTAIRETGEKFFLEPDAKGWGDMDVHIIHMTTLGTIKPHTDSALVVFFPTEDTEYPFRLVQVILTPAKYQLSSMH